MKTLVILSLGLAVALGMPPFVPDVAQNPVLIKEEQSPLLGDLVPLQGHVEVEDPAPQGRLGSKEQQEKMVPETDQTLLLAQAKKDSMMEVEAEVKPEVKMEPMEKDSMVELEIKVKPEDKVDPELKAEQEVNMERDVKVDPEAKVDAEVHLNPEVMAELEVKVKSEVKVEPDIQWEPEVKPIFSNEQEVQEEFQVQETESGVEVEERHIDMEGKSEMMGEPVMEPLDDDNMFEEDLSNTELSEVEKSMRAAFQSRDPDAELLPEEEEIMDTREEAFLDQQVMPDSAVMDEGPALDIMGQEISPLEDYFPNKEAMMGPELPKQHDSDYLMMEGAGSESAGEEESPMIGMPLSEEPAMEDSPVLDGGVQIGVMPKRENRILMQQGVQKLPKATGQSSCPGVVLERKCYQFFRGPKKAVDAEFFCQNHFPGGHLASITSQYIHREVMNMMLRQNGAYTRTWIGGLRYLETGHFIWLDGSHWTYADWLSGEPNNTADVEDCVEVLAFGNGKFNDFTCWEPQAFICSYSYQ